MLSVQFRNKNSFWSISFDILPSIEVRNHRYLYGNKILEYPESDLHYVKCGSKSISLIDPN